MRSAGYILAAKAIFLSIVSCVVIFPIYAAFIGGFKTNADLQNNPFGLPSVWHLEFYAQILNDHRLWVYLGNSLYIALATVVLTIIVGAMAAYAFAQVRFFGSGFIYNYLLLGLMFPLAAAIVPLFLIIRDTGLLNSRWAVILPQVAFGMAFSVMFFRSFFQQLPKELFEAARVDGCGYIRFFFTFTIPLSTPILATISVFVFVSSWNNYIFPLIMLNDKNYYTWTLGAMDFRGQYITEWNRMLAFVTITLAPALIFFLMAQKYIVSGLTGGAVKG